MQNTKEPSFNINQMGYHIGNEALKCIQTIIENKDLSRF